MEYSHICASVAAQFHAFRGESLQSVKMSEDEIDFCVSKATLEQNICLRCGNFSHFEWIWTLATRLPMGKELFFSPGFYSSNFKLICVILSEFMPVPLAILFKEGPNRLEISINLVNSSCL